jgi:hypothetical protein
MRRKEIAGKEFEVSIPNETKQPASMVVRPIHFLSARLPIAVPVASAKMAKVGNRFRPASRGA